ncbi:unnamed protein product, partial [Mesorhabditis belari]|uniref:Uncharacterized protein n=1 Tax=Mesorhabditis belari TaxID=2138241 RepID=A0AAF3ELY1_9BILA
MLGVVYLLLYIPTIYAILKLRLTKNPCYQVGKRGSWMFASPLYVILAFNRFIVITGWVKVTHYVTRIPIYFWLILASAWSFYTGVIHKPLIYNSKSFLAFYIPFIEDQQIALVQAAFLTCPAIIGCFLYLYIQFSNKSTVGWAILGQFLWQTITGLGAIIYLTLNQSVRDFYFHRSAVYHDGSRHFDISKTSGERERNETGNS